MTLGTEDIIVHRGMGKPENTISSFEKSMSRGYHFVELDVHLTLDENWIVFHDFEYSKGKKIEESNTQEVKNSKEYEVPQLTEVLTKLPKLRVNIELKVPKNDENSFNIGKKFGKFIDSYFSVERGYISSFNSKALKGVRASNQEVKLSYLTTRPKPSEWELLNRKIDLYSVNPLFILLREKHVIWAHKNNLEVHPWVVNHRRMILRMMRLGVDKLITDKPDQVKSVIETT